LSRRYNFRITSWYLSTSEEKNNTPNERTKTYLLKTRRIFLHLILSLTFYCQYTFQKWSTRTF